MRGIQIEQVGDSPRGVGRALMSPHHLSGRVWMSAALLALVLPAEVRLGRWLPLHLALLGAVTQVIVGGQLMFSATLALKRGPSMRAVLVQLAALNFGAGCVIAGRLIDSTKLLATGALLLAAAVLWGIFTVARLWWRSPNTRFRITGTFYGLAGVAVLFGFLVGWEMASGAAAATYFEHMVAHMSVNLVGWAGLTILGTIVTLLPSFMHVRAPDHRRLRPAPWLIAGGLIAFVPGLVFHITPLAFAGTSAIAVAVVLVATYVRSLLSIPRRRRIPSGAFHLLAALAWLGVYTLSAPFLVVRSDLVRLHDLALSGLAIGFVVQAVLGAWSFLLPAARLVTPDERRRELVSFELGGRVQVVVYNAAVLLLLAPGIAGAPSGLATLGYGLLVIAATAALTKSWTFPRLARLQLVARWSQAWWEPPEAA